MTIFAFIQESGYNTSFSKKAGGTFHKTRKARKSGPRAGPRGVRGKISGARRGGGPYGGPGPLHRSAPPYAGRKSGTTGKQGNSSRRMRMAERAASKLKKRRPGKEGKGKSLIVREEFLRPGCALPPSAARRGWEGRETGEGAEVWRAAGQRQHT